MSKLPDYTMVIATYQRPDALGRALASLAAQSHLPKCVVVVDASDGEGAACNQDIIGKASPALAITYQKADTPGASAQRNQGMRDVSTPLIGFMDDDAEAKSQTLALLASCFAEDGEERLGGAGGRMEPGGEATAARGVLWWYYRLQAGYAHPHYGGQLFGPALNTFPCWSQETGDVLETQWLGTTCVLYRTPLVQALKFPEFPGYSAAEDVYLSASAARTHRLVICRDATFYHADEGSDFKRNRAAIMRRYLRNQRCIAREVMGLSAATVFWKQALHRLFLSMVLLRARRPGWWNELGGVWT